VKYKTIEEGYFVRLEKGEKLMETLGKFVSGKRIPSAFLSGIGAVRQSTLAFYILKEKRYAEKLFPEEMELVSIIGNLSWINYKPILHLHATMADTEHRCFGGHLIETEVAVTAEIRISVNKENVERKMDEEIGLNLLDLHEI